MVNYWFLVCGLWFGGVFYFGTFHILVSNWGVSE